MIVATKVGHNRDLRREAILEGAKRSLERLQTDHIDLYYMHNDDPDTPFEESLGAFGELVRDGKVRYIGASNFTAERLAEALDVAEREGLPAVVALQNEYNLVDARLRGRRRARSSPRAALARGPLLRARVRLPDRQVPARRRRRRQPARAGRARARSTSAGVAVLAALDEIAAGARDDAGRGRARLAAAQPTVVAPIASARTVEQLDELLPFMTLELDARRARAAQPRRLTSRRGCARARRWRPRSSAPGSLASDRARGERRRRLAR